MQFYGLEDLYSASSKADSDNVGAASAEIRTADQHKNKGINQLTDFVLSEANYIFSSF